MDDCCSPFTQYCVNVNNNTQVKNAPKYTNASCASDHFPPDSMFFILATTNLSSIDCPVFALYLSPQLFYPPSFTVPLGRRRPIRCDWSRQGHSSIPSCAVRIISSCFVFGTSRVLKNEELYRRDAFLSTSFVSRLDSNNFATFLHLAKKKQFESARETEEMPPFLSHPFSFLRVLSTLSFTFFSLISSSLGFFSRFLFRFLIHTLLPIAQGRTGPGILLSGF